MTALNKTWKLFQAEDGEVFMCVYGMNLYNDEGAEVFAVGVTDGTAKLLAYQWNGSWVNDED